MFEGLNWASEAVGGHADRDTCRPAEFVIDHDTGPDALAALRTHARAENIAAAHKILTLAAFARRAFEDDLDRFGEDVALERGGRGAETEAALALGLSSSAAGKYVTVGNNLDHHLPLTRAAFLDGSLDYSRVRTISEFTDHVSPATLEALEPLAVDAARQRPPRALAAEIMRQLIRINPDEAQRLRKRRERNSRCISVSPDRHGMATLFGTLTATEGQAVAGLIEEMCGTVCPADPRTRDNLQTDAFVALMHGEQHLTCQCPDQACPTKFLPAHERERGKVEVQLHIDLDTLLGLVDDPGFLSGHGPIDPELARRIAEDATWQAIIADARKVAAERDAAESDSVNSDDVGIPDRKSSRGDGDPLDDENLAEHPAEPSQAAPAAPGVPTRYRTRRRPAGTVPPPPCEPPPSWQDPPLPPPRTDLTPEITTGDILDAIDTDPSLLDGEFPDGHGGFAIPPRGALTYRPPNAVRRAVFAKYSTCTFPGCTVPTRKCQFDHIVEYDHTAPERGGWSVETNGQPACKLHHQAKTDRHFRVVRVSEDVIVWVGRNGAVGVTLPDRYAATAPPTQPKTRTPASPPPAEEPPDPLIYEPTWWEAHMRAGDRPPTLEELTTVTDPEHLARCRRLRAHHTEHLAVLAAREHHAPPPF